MASSQTRFYGLLAVILVAGVAIIGYVAVREDQAATTDAGSAVLADMSSGELVGAEVGVARGPEDAPVLIEEYADYLCGYCQMVATLTLPQVMERYVDTGRARFVFYDFPLHEESLPAAEAARCAGDQDAFWPMSEMLFTRMREWRTERDPVSKFGDYAEQLGLDGGQLEDCVESGKHRETVLRSQLRARQLGLSGTPTFIINGRRVGTMGFDQMAAIIEAELAKQ